MQSQTSTCTHPLRITVEHIATAVEEFHDERCVRQGGASARCAQIGRRPELAIQPDVMHIYMERTACETSVRLRKPVE